MKKTIAYYFAFLLGSVPLVWGQSTPSDSIQFLEEIILHSNSKHEDLLERNSSLEAYLKDSKKVDMIQRGYYAWEPVLNNMATERLSITLDGMQIFQACTDKMDPITSYVETHNLRQATVVSGQAGNRFGSGLGGSIHLESIRPQFSQTPSWTGKLNLGYSHNNQQQNLNYSSIYSTSKWFFQTQATFREAQNYKAGQHQEIEHSQFRKLNLSTSIGYALTENQTLESQIIYDKATDIGYPALPMDVSLAEALITSVTYTLKPANAWVDHWENKLYYNNVTHRMDDTQRPPETIAMHMDMPGWTHTLGFNSILHRHTEKHNWISTFRTYRNQSLAQMTMYPNDSNEKNMFMYTWPDVTTLEQGLTIEDHWMVSPTVDLKFLAASSWHRNQLQNDAAKASLEVLYPDLKTSKDRFLNSLSMHTTWNKHLLAYGFGIAYGNRAPSVSEAYGFYIFNNAENRDYIGNPFLKNERALELNLTFALQFHTIENRLSLSGFHIQNYILGIPEPQLIPMTLGALGVKSYQNIPYAQLATLRWDFNFFLNKAWTFESYVSYHYGSDAEGKALPLISPIQYSAQLEYQHRFFTSQLTAVGNSKQNSQNSVYGAPTTPAHIVFNWNAAVPIQWGSANVLLTIGIDNISDQFYTTYADWNGIPRMGRNYKINLHYKW